MSRKTAIAIIGSGNIGTDLLIKILRLSQELEPVIMVGIDPESDGLARAQRLGVDTTHEGIDGLLKHPRFGEIEIVYDATSAKAHLHHAEVLKEKGKRVIDLTPAAVGPYVVPVANIEEHLDAPNINLVTCGGQATIPIVWAVNQVSDVLWGEIVASISSKSAGPGTRANIDEFTETTARGIEEIGGASRGKAIIILNPAEPPLIMRDTVYTLSSGGSQDEISQSIHEVVARVAEYVPGYRLLKDPIFDEVSVRLPDGSAGEGIKTTVLLEVEGAGHYLPKYAGNLDIMTSAARRMGEMLSRHITSAETT